MQSDAADLVLGIDGGGTKTLAWLALRDATAATEGSAVGESTPSPIVGQGRAGPSNPCAVGFAQATQAIREAVDAAFANANREVGPVAAACLSIAGTEPPAEKERMARWTNDQAVARQVVLSNDAEPILACAGGCGVALIAGTGSFAVGRDAGGRTQQVGGWGYRFGDEGSGYAIARDGIAAAFLATDGRGRETQILAKLYEEFGVATPRALVSRLYDEKMDRRHIADLAPLVMEAARSGDEVASAVLASAADDLARIVQTLSDQLRLPNPLSLAVAGGVLVGCESLRSRLLDTLSRGGIGARLTVVAEPVQGAVEMARQLAQRQT